jgi:hypothetical protein
MPKNYPVVGPDDEDRRLLVIDLGGGVVQGVETNIPELQGVTVLVLGDKKDSQGDWDEVVIEGTDRNVYQAERVAISDCTWLLKSLTQYESQKVDADLPEAPVPQLGEGANVPGRQPAGFDLQRRGAEQPSASQDA